MLFEPSVDLFSTCPASTSVAKDRYVQRVAEVARWSEQSGCKGILVYSDNSLLDPWLLAHIIIQNTTALCPLVAVQPVYMHPYAVAKQITSFAYLYGRRLYLNMVAGGFKNDLDALSDTTPHDKRYARLVEYIEAGDSAGAERLWRKHITQTTAFLTEGPTASTVLELFS